MQLAEVIKVLDQLGSSGVRCWVAGGWGIDALVGRQTRPHRDLDLAVDAASFDVCLSVLAELGYQVETDWLPLRVEVAAPGDRWVDVHPVVFDADGHGVQGDPAALHFDYPLEAFTTGWLTAEPGLRRRVPCLSVDQQRRFHSGYEPRPQDLHDLALLAALDRP